MLMVIGNEKEQKIWQTHDGGGFGDWRPAGHGENKVPEVPLLSQSVRPP